MAFSRHTSRIYMEPDDIAGALNVLNRRISDDSYSDQHDFYVGASIALDLINCQETIRTQADFLRMFDVLLFESGCTPLPIGGNDIEEI